jgi:hypothetical protein
MRRQLVEEPFDERTLILLAKRPVVSRTTDDCREALERRLGEMRPGCIEAKRAPACPCRLGNDFEGNPPPGLTLSAGIFGSRAACGINAACSACATSSRLYSHPGASA